MLHIMDNRSFSRNRLEQEVLNLLRQRFPSGWKLAAKPPPPKLRPAPDFILTLTGPNGERIKIMVEIKNQLEPKNAAALAEQLRRCARNFGEEAMPLVAAPFLSVSARERLKELGISYADTTGNVRVIASRPALFIETCGVERNPYREQRQAQSLKGAKAGRIVRALCDAKPPFAVRKLAQAAGIDPGYVSRILAFLDDEELIRRERRGPVIEVRWRKLIERWARDYSFMEFNRVVSYLEPRGLSDFPPRLAAAARRIAVTGSYAVSAIAPVAPARLLAAYVESPEDTARRLGLIPAESGANVLLAEPYDAVVFERMEERGGMPCVALSQAAVDLLTSPGRAPAEAQALLGWMEANEPAWRR